MILVVGGIKGGSGKTTLATNLTVMRSANGKKVLLVDADEQKSASDWNEQRQALGITTPWSTIQLSGEYIYSQLEKMKKDYDDIIIDVGGRDTTSQRSCLTIADVFVIPFKPRSFDIWTIGSVKKMIFEINIINPDLKTFAVINQGDPKGQDNHNSFEILSECPNLIMVEKFICHRKSFSNASSDGLGIIEIRNSDKKALEEITFLYEKIYTNNLVEQSK